MADINDNLHLDIFLDKCELHQGDAVSVFREGRQNQETRQRYAHISNVLSNGYLDNTMNEVINADFSDMSSTNQILLKNLVGGVTSEVGRALVGLAFLQLTIKSICPEQSIRLHKGGTRQGSFSWTEGISMRTLDSQYNTPFLRAHNLLRMNQDGVMMTRSLAENYPYSKLYKADMRGPFDEWIAIVDALEDGTMPPKLGLQFLMALLKNRSEAFKSLASDAVSTARSFSPNFERIKNILKTFFNTTDYSARAFEVVLHSFMQALEELGYLNELSLVELSQMRSANKKHGNIGDIELKNGNSIIEAWDAKYGKPYLRDELEELRDKIALSPSVKTAGFIVDTAADMRPEIRNRINEISLEYGITVVICTFDQWIAEQTSMLDIQSKNKLAQHWLIAVTESFAQFRPHIAPIDEPCDRWLNDLQHLLL